MLQQVRLALYRMRSPGVRRWLRRRRTADPGRRYVERGLAKSLSSRTSTAPGVPSRPSRSPLSLAIRELGVQPGRSMATIQAAIIAYYESHTITARAHTHTQASVCPRASLFRTA